MDVVSEILNKTSNQFKPITVNKHIDLEYDVGNLLAVDNNELDFKKLRKNQNEYLLDLTRDNTQLLINKIFELPTERVEEAIVAKLPPGIYVLPRAKPVPKPRPLTKWEKFAKEKGIQKTKKAKLTWDEELKKWIPRYGFKKAQAEKDKDWVIEVPQNADPYEDQFAKKSEIKAEKVAKNELQRLRNIAKAKKVKIPKTGLLNPEVSNAKDLQAAVTVARTSTASVGKFQDRLPKEKDAKGVSDIIPTTRKRKLPPVEPKQEQAENLAVIDTILNKKPKLNIEKAVSIHINEEQQRRAQEKKEMPSKKRPAGKKGTGAGKKPKGGKGVRKGVGNKGRKRR